MYAVYGLGLVNFANAPMTTLNQRKSPPKRKVTRGVLAIFRVSPFLAGDEQTDRLLVVRLLRLLSLFFNEKKN